MASPFNPATLPSRDRLPADKKSLRALMRRARTSLTDTEIEKRSREAMSRLWTARAAEAASRNWLLYSPVKNELDPGYLCTILLEHGVTPAFPRVQGQKMLFCRIEDPAKELVPGSFGVREPAPGCPVLEDFSPQDIVCVPGLAFSPTGERLGYGKGFYDRFLKDFPGTSIGLLYQFQLVDRINTFAHDTRVEYLCSESGLLPAKPDSAITRH